MKAASVALLLAAAIVQAGPPSQLVARDVFLMGTRATLSTWDGDRTTGLGRLESLLRPIEETEAQLSTWRPASEVSRLNASAGEPFHLSATLCRVFERLDYWVTATDGAFDPAIGALTAAWDIHGRGRVPGRPALARAAAHSGWSKVAFDPAACTVSMPHGVSIDVGGFGKGEGLDRARAALAADGHPWLIDFGGQVAVQGAPAGTGGWEVGVAHPQRRSEAVDRLRLTTGSIATSAGSERDLRAGAGRIGHIIDPRTGRPAAFSGSVLVWHPSALAADVLSTALYVMGPDAGMRWAEARDIAVCYLEAAGQGPVRSRRSPAFVRRFRAS